MSKLACFFMLDLNGGGIERTTLTLARQFRDRGYRVDIVVLRLRGALLGRVPDGVRLVPLKVSGTRGGHLRGIPAFSRYLKDSRPDAVVSSTPWINIIAISAKLLSRVETRVITTDRSDPRKAYFHGGFLHRMAVPKLAKALYPRADVNACVCDGVRQELAGVMGWPPDRLKVLYNPTDTAPIGAGAPPTHRWLLDKAGYKVIVAAGRLAEQKDFPTLLRAFSILRGSREDIRLIIFGEGPLARELRALAKELGVAEEVDLPGFSHHIRSEIAASDLFVLSSAWEGLSNALVEALSERTPVVSTDCPFGSAEVLSGYDCGRLVPVGDFRAMAAAMDEMLDWPVDIDPEIVTRFSIPTAMKAYEDCLFGPDRGQAV